jgi:RNA polymerase sigma factor (sigma-70 family)
MSSVIGEIYERCLRRYPSVQLSLEDFQARIDEILNQGVSASGESSRSKLLDRIHHEDLFLATACSFNDRIAWEHFSEDYLPMLRRFAAQACGNIDDGEDLSQEIIIRMLDERKRLAGYGGRCSMVGWLRVVVSHAAVDRFRRTCKQVSLEELQENEGEAVLIDPNNEDPEVEDSRWVPVVSGIVNETMSNLSPRDRLILGLYKVIGGQFGIHEATMSRWMDRLRRDMRSRVEKELRKRHGLRASEIRALFDKISLESVVEPIAGALSRSDAKKNEKVDGYAQNKSARQMD